MIEVTLPTKELRKLEKAVEQAGKKLPGQVASAVNRTATRTRTHVSREIRKELAAPAKVVNNTLRKTKATRKRPGAVVTLERSRRIPLRDFGARQTRAGVSYRISKQGGRQTAKSAFMISKMNNRVFKRKGRTRLPIGQLYGPSPWGVFIKRKLKKPTLRFVQRELKKQMQQRIEFNVLKASGAI